MLAKDRIIFPLDGMDYWRSKVWIERLAGRVGYVKVGLELFLRGGWEAVDTAHKNGHKVMLDLKLHDISATMKGATREAIQHGVDLLTVHANAGRDAMAKCVEITQDTKTSIVAVTVLTSLNEEFMQRVYQPLRHEAGCIPNIVEALTVEATEAGVDWFVCSPLEATLIHAVRDLDEPDCDTTIITPGIRMAGGEKHDQKRTNTPGAAISSGADYIVVGRAIREAEDYAQAIDAVCADINETL